MFRSVSVRMAGREPSMVAFLLPSVTGNHDGPYSNVLCLFAVLLRVLDFVQGAPSGMRSTPTQARGRINIWMLFLPT